MKHRPHHPQVKTYITTHTPPTGENIHHHPHTTHKKQRPTPRQMKKHIQKINTHTHIHTYLNSERVLLSRHGSKSYLQVWLGWEGATSLVNSGRERGPVVEQFVGEEALAFPLAFDPLPFATDLTFGYDWSSLPGAGWGYR